MITVEDLTMSYGATVIQRDLRFEVATGDIFVILGGSGCGKSTLLRHLIGLKAPLAGSIEIAGIGAPRLASEAPAYGVMFQSGALFGSMSLAENVALPLEKWTDLSRRDVETVVRDRLRLVDLEIHVHKMPGELSGGQKKRAGIARALALEPSLLFLDEPSAGLDPISAFELDELIQALSRSLGVTTVLVTHELDSIFKVATRCIMLDRNTKERPSRGIIARGDPRHLKGFADEPCDCCWVTDDPELAGFVAAFFNRRSTGG